MMDAGLLVWGAVAVTCFIAAWRLTGLVLSWLMAHAILDTPNDRSSHTVPTPRGGGWGILLTLLPAWAAISFVTDTELLLAPILAGAGLLMAVSWIDDRRGLGPVPRFLLQIAAVGVGLAGLPSESTVFQGWLPVWLDRFVAAIGWLWFVNLFNFMDGIDGLAGGEAASIGIGIAIVTLAFGLPPVFGALGVAVAGAAIGFLIWNWHPARLFMGDVGSVPLGYVLGWLLLFLAASGAWVPALLLPAYFLCDATLTLLRRALRGEKVWKAHREHFYQKASRACGRHDRVTLTVLGANAALVALSALATGAPWASLSGGLVVIVALLVRLSRMGRAAPIKAEAAGSGHAGLR